MYDGLELLFLAAAVTTRRRRAGVQGKHVSVKGGVPPIGDTTLTFTRSTIKTWGHRPKEPKWNKNVAKTC